MQAERANVPGRPPPQGTRAGWEGMGGEGKECFTLQTPDRGGIWGLSPPPPALGDLAPPEPHPHPQTVSKQPPRDAEPRHSSSSWARGNMHGAGAGGCCCRSVSSPLTSHLHPQPPQQTDRRTDQQAQTRACRESLAELFRAGMHAPGEQGASHHAPTFRSRILGAAASRPPKTHHMLTKRGHAPHGDARTRTRSPPRGWVRGLSRRRWPR